ncbi:MULTISPECIES: AraC family transcriptional regulator [Clostridia]|uniref:AraC family transcriptional regulator n=1 Tax=Lacrimispora celerecrescens TaxID=29354 RepID=A0A084JH26_9FIRM|nr:MULTISPECIES: AraC family transcriptional regulator [Clostridia]KEZ88260.1 AraC family transcriptional regulator [Lacrimispora celerecrescens]MBW4847123.1 AraC family transcriptional regulator [Lachnospiraceae bacterium]MSS08668.1 AraC family transcriptional regulator [Clostridium sp. WB02_MRS01]
MNQEILDRLGVITDEEREIINGRTEIDRNRYTEGQELVIDSKKMLEHGKMIRIRPHTRFVHFPKHKHNYIEVIYMCKGETVHFIDGEKVVLKTGELLFLNQHATQEILPAGEEDIGINFIILPEFFDTAFEMMGEEENLLRDFLVGCLCFDPRYASYLHFQVADVLPVQNLVENMVWTLLSDQPNKRSINQITMGLLFLQLMHYTDKISHTLESFEQKLIFQVLTYIDENYKDGELTELSALLSYNIYWLSRAIKRLTGRTYKELLQVKRLNQASVLLLNTRLSVTDISIAVGYDNTSYFHRIFRNYYGMSPKEYRASDT